MKKLITCLSILLLITFIGCGNKDSTNSKDSNSKSEGKGVKDKKKDKGKKDEKKTDAVPVEVVKAGKGNISSFLLFSSNVDSEKYVKVYPMISGIITKINRDEGDKVKKNAVLAVLDDREALINERKAAIDLEKLKAEFGRQKEMFEKELISEETFEKLRFSLKQSELDWKYKKLMLSYTRITSPIEGVITKRNIKTGNKINTSDHSFTVIASKEKIAVVNIPEQEKNSVYSGQKAIVSDNSQEVTGKVKRISPAIDPQSGTFKVTVELDDTAEKMLIGQFVNVKIIKKVHENVILLSKDAIVYEGGYVFVYIVGKDGYATKTQVTTGFEDKNLVEISEGLEENQEVVTAGKSSLKKRTLVNVIDQGN